MIGLDLLGHRADVAKFHAELVIGRAGLRVMGSPSVVAEGLKPREDFIDGHADDYTRNSRKANRDRRSLQIGCVCCRGTAAMKVLIIAATGVQPFPEPLGRPQSVLKLASARQPNDVPTRR